MVESLPTGMAWSALHPSGSLVSVLQSVLLTVPATVPCSGFTPHPTSP